MLLCASLLATLIAQPLAELESSPQRTVLLLRDGGGALVVFRYDVRLEAGAREISWRPDLPGLKREEARLSVSPEDAAQVGGAVLDPTRVRWSLSVPRDCAGAFSVTTPLADFAWSVQAEGSLIPIEVKLSATPNLGMVRGIEAFRRDFPKRAAKGYVVHAGDMWLPLGPDATALPFADF